MEICNVVWAAAWYLCLKYVALWCKISHSIFCNIVIIWIKIMCIYCHIYHGNIWCILLVFHHWWYHVISMMYCNHLNWSLVVNFTVIIQVQFKWSALLNISTLYSTIFLHNTILYWQKNHCQSSCLNQGFNFSQ